METLGGYLQRMRNDRGLTMEDVVDRSKISPVYIQALETDDWRSIPSEVFARGFVKLYARCLDLDETSVLARHADTIHAFFEAREAKSRETEQRNAEIERTTRSRKRYRNVVVAVLFLAVAAGTLLFVYGNRKGGDEGESQEDRQNPPIAGKQPVQPAPALQPAEPPVVTPRERHALTLKARETTWAQVLIDGEVNREVLLQPGDTVTWEAETSFKLDVGNVGGVVVTFDGRELPPLGESGKVRKGIILPAPRVTEPPASQQARDQDLEASP